MIRKSEKLPEATSDLVQMKQRAAQNKKKIKVKKRRRRRVSGKESFIMFFWFVNSIRRMIVK